ncbi:pseudouridine synthase [Microaceticoccus formicicus]|uniref:pseudouridine synthase n=1 Tax=Microaceticoccus formicicus TaxID=3118105 RepID=UPI003CD011AB|nr:pseudouridine synthase [Peptoniphilaceae bacterium AMB_02]
MRLNKYIARSGYCSRRKADELIFDGLVTVDGQVCSNPATQVEPSVNEVRVSNKIINLIHNNDYLMLNKPIGYMSSLNDPHYDKFVIDLLPEKYNTVYPIGRLDVDSHGLLLLTNDGDLTYKLTHPKNNIVKEYIVSIDKKLNSEDLKKLESGVMIDNKYICKAKIKVHPSKNGFRYRVYISEGRNRQIRKMFAALGYEVIDLMRVAIEELSIGDLKTGEFRLLTESEIKYLEDL